MITLKLTTLSLPDIEALRDRNYRRSPELALKTVADARQFIDEVGCCLLFPAQGVELPSLWEAINGRRRPLPRHHFDRALHLTWQWKDDLPKQRDAFYGKLLKGKPTLVSLKLFPYLYAFSDNYGSLDDYLEAYEEGRMSEEARRIYEVLLQRGPCATGVLRREAGLWGRSNMARFDRAIAELQRGLKIVKCGISEANRWKYSYIYDLLPRWLPEQVEQGVGIPTREAIRAIALQYLRVTVATPHDAILHLFNWDPRVASRVLADMLAQSELMEVAVAGDKWLACREAINEL